MMASVRPHDSSHRAPRGARRDWLVVSLLLAGIYAAGVSSVVFAPTGSKFAVWWPAAGLAVALLLLAPRRWRWALAVGVVISSGLANYTAGRPPAAALGFGISNASEAVLVAYWMTRGVTGRPSLRTQDDLWRLLSGTFLGVTVMGLGGGLTVAYLLDGSFLETARAVMASHGAAILVIVPLALAIHAVPLADRRREAVLQWAAALAITAYVFSPGQVLGLAFLPMPVLMWAAMRFGVRAVSWQLLTVGVMTSAMSAQGWGPFAVGGASQVTSHETTASMVQAFLIACALIALPLAVVVEQRRTALARVTASEELFRQSFSESLVGMLLLRSGTDGLRIIELNNTAAEILGGTVEDLEGRSWSSMLDTAVSLDEVAGQMLAGEITGWRDELDLLGDQPRRVGVALSPLSAQGDEPMPMFTAQMIDITAAHEAGQRLRTEKDFTAAVLNTTGCIIIAVDVTGVVVGMNPAAQRATGLGETDVIGRHLWDVLIPAENRGATRAMFTEGRRIPRTYEGALLTGGEGLRQVVWTTAYLDDERGVATHVVMTGIDVTDERTARTLVNHLLESATATSIIGTDLEGRVTVFNTGAAQMLGYSAEEMVHVRPLELIHDPVEVTARAAELGIEPGFGVLVAHLRDDDEPETRDWTYVREDGTRFPVSLTMSAVKDTFGRRIGYLGVGRDVTEPRRSQHRLLDTLEKERQAMDRLQELDRAKSDFVSTVSHELRTPITSIVGYTEMLQDGLAGAVTPEQDRLVDAVRRNGERLISLIEDLLTLSSIEAGTFVLDKATVDLRSVVARAQEALRPLVASRRLDVTFDVPDRPVAVRGEGGQLERVVLNLVSNAVKFTEDGGRVTCVLREAGGVALVEVTDTGIGIPADEQPGLFTRFFRSSTTQERAIQGTGLGLSIVDSIVRAHGGEITVRSAHLAGSTFRVTLALTQRVEEPAGVSGSPG